MELRPSGPAPAPRYDHVATLLATSANASAPEKLLLLGGRDSQQRFKDVHVLDLATKSWEGGHSIPPLSHEARAGWRAAGRPAGCCVPRTGLCSRGWRRHTLPARPVRPAPTPQGCNNLCTAVEAVPFHKVFNFGGKAGTMDFLNEVAVMDCGSRFWAAPEVLGSPPCAR